MTTHEEILRLKSEIADLAHEVKRVQFDIAKLNEQLKKLVEYVIKMTPPATPGAGNIW